ncbi:hypothetical protein EGW08_018772 [Elysia chlorotica]|uniref:Uncharacterized protein n=1 Tax=Elysia chlorotica TaxID=188477 RepID=A0A3S1BRX3_ELYCH|nr:hypothetical protein EGW08_018772 [Elysia chlorotica]
MGFRVADVALAALVFPASILHYLRRLRPQIAPRLTVRVYLEETCSPVTNIIGSNWTCADLSYSLNIHDSDELAIGDRRVSSIKNLGTSELLLIVKSSTNWAIWRRVTYISSMFRSICLGPAPQVPGVRLCDPGSRMADCLTLYRALNVTGSTPSRLISGCPSDPIPSCKPQTPQVQYTVHPPTHTATDLRPGKVRSVYSHYSLQGTWRAGPRKLFPPDPSTGTPQVPQYRLYHTLEVTRLGAGDSKLVSDLVPPEDLVRAPSFLKLDACFLKYNVQDEDFGS